MRTLLNVTNYLMVKLSPSHFPPIWISRRPKLRAMNKKDILREIKRTAEANGGVPLGWRKFQSETGIKYSDWHGKHWVHWNDAIREAGYVPNQFQSSYDSSELLEKVTPEYETHLGWQAPTNDCRSWEELPAAAKAYLARLEASVDVQIRYISIGAARREIIRVPPGGVAAAREGVASTLETG